MNELIITSGILTSAICGYFIAYYYLKNAVETAKEELVETKQLIRQMQNNSALVQKLKESKRKIKFNATDIENMQRMKRRGYSNEKIAKYFGVSDETIRLRLKELE
jgi:hypothetical protein